MMSNDQPSQRPAPDPPAPAPHPPAPTAATPPTSTAIPTARLQPAPARRFTWAWLAPVAAVALAALLLFQGQAERGRTIRISFEHGAGLQPNDPVMYRGVQAGRIKSVTFSPDLNTVVVSAELRRDASNIAVDGSKFWIVRPEVSLTRVSGLETIVGPRYVEVDPGPLSTTPRSDFVGVDRAPSRIEGAPRRRGAAGKLPLTIAAPRRGSITIGSPIFFRDIKVGAVTSFHLSEDARTVEIDASIEAEYAGLVRTNSEFWNAGGIDLDFGFSTGLSMKAGSIESVFGGGIAFATPTKAATRVQPGHRFLLSPEPQKNWWEWSPDLTEPPPSSDAAPAPDSQTPASPPAPAPAR